RYNELPVCTSAAPPTGFRGEPASTLIVMALATTVVLMTVSCGTLEGAVGLPPPHACSSDASPPSDAAWHACRQKSRPVAKPGASSLCMETTNTSVLANVSSPSSSLFSNLHRYIATETAQPIAQIGRADESIADAAVDAQPVGDSPEGRSLRLGDEEVVAHGD